MSLVVVVVAAAIAPRIVSWTQWVNVIGVIVWVWLWWSRLQLMPPETQTATFSQSLLSTPRLYHRSVTESWFVSCLLCRRFSWMVFTLQWLHRRPYFNCGCLGCRGAWVQRPTVDLGVPTWINPPLDRFNLTFSQKGTKRNTQHQYNTCLE